MSSGEDWKGEKKNKIIKYNELNYEDKNSKNEDNKE